MAKEKYTEFVFGETPTYFVAGIDMFIQCATWFDSEECWSKELLEERTLLASVGLNPALRTKPLKLYTFLNATRPKMNLWREVNIAFVLFHLGVQKDSKIYVVDGYPRFVWNIVDHKIADFIKDGWFDADQAYDVLKRISYVPCKDEAEYIRTVKNLEVLAEEHTRLYQPHLLLEEDDIPGFKEYNECLHSKAVANMQAAHGTQHGNWAGGLTADPLTMEEIDTMYDDDNDEDDGGLQ